MTILNSANRENHEDFPSGLEQPDVADFSFGQARYHHLGYPDNSYALPIEAISAFAPLREMLGKVLSERLFCSLSSEDYHMVYSYVDEKFLSVGDFFCFDGFESVGISSDGVNLILGVSSWIVLELSDSIRNKGDTLSIDLECLRHSLAGMYHEMGKGGMIAEIPFCLLRT